MKNWNIIIYIVLLAIILFLIIKPDNLNLNIFENKNGKNIPEECKVPAGQSIQSWKEHLGHHENTRYCLEYYN